MASGTPIALSSLALSKNRFVHCTVPDDCDLAFLHTMMTLRVFCDRKSVVSANFLRLCAILLFFLYRTKNVKR